MIRILIFAAIACVVCKVVLGKWPWQYLSTAPTGNPAVFNARKLLGVSARASPAEIRAAHKRLVAMVHPDRGGSSAQIHEADAARDVLLNELPHDTGTPK